MTWHDFSNLAQPGNLDYMTMGDGTRIRYAFWPSLAKSRGIIVLVSGHRDYMEKYSAFISDFLNRGFAVYSFDNRGQGLSDRLHPNRLPQGTGPVGSSPHQLASLGSPNKHPRPMMYLLTIF